MAQGKGQLEIQLGHLCNNRCVFCVSGQLTSRGEAPFLPIEELYRALEEGWAAGQRRVTLLGGEPTIQPYFMDVLRRAVAIGFEVVIFSNGSKPGRTKLIDEVAAIGGKVEWRFSFQGGTREAHERTTRRRGSFAQLVRSVDRARAHGHRVTVNMCVVRQNKDSVDAFPELLLPRGIAQLHLDMVNPYDTGTLDAEGVTAILPKYSELVAPLERMIARFPEGFDVNIGNLPYCVAPHLARWIHHGGERTWTITANDHGASELGQGRRKYVLKQAFKSKPESCKRCIFDERCSGVFDAYAERFGVGELAPVTAEDPRIDPQGDVFALRAAHVLRGALRRAAVPRPFERARVTEVGPKELAIELTAAGGEPLGLTEPTLRGEPLGLAEPTLRGEKVELSMVPVAEQGSAGEGAVFATSLGAVLVRSAEASREAVSGALTWLFDASISAGAKGIHPPGPDAVGAVPRGVAARLARLRARAPFGGLAWTRVDAIPGGVEITLVSPGGVRVVAFLTEAPRTAAVRAGYRVDASENTESVTSAVVLDGVRRLLVALGRLPEAALAEALS